jgi:hypothetical protein
MPYHGSQAMNRNAASVTTWCHPLGVAHWGSVMERSDFVERSNQVKSPTELFARLLSTTRSEGFDLPPAVARRYPPHERAYPGDPDVLKLGKVPPTTPTNLGRRHLAFPWQFFDNFGCAHGTKMTTHNRVLLQLVQVEGHEPRCKVALMGGRQSAP